MSDERWEKRYDEESQMFGIWWAGEDAYKGNIGDVWTGAYADAIISNHAKAALLDEAVRALEPFAKLAMPGREGLPDDRKYLVVDNTWLTLGDFRRATAIFTRLRDVPVHDTKGEA